MEKKGANYGGNTRGRTRCLTTRHHLPSRRVRETHTCEARGGTTPQERRRAHARNQTGGGNNAGAEEQGMAAKHTAKNADKERARHRESHHKQGRASGTSGKGNRTHRRERIVITTLLTRGETSSRTERTQQTKRAKEE